MYSVSLFNGAVETVIHYPSADKDTPHLLTLPFKESLSQAEQLSFSIPYGNPGYSIVEGLVTKVKVIDTRDNSVVFSGRALNTKDGMSSDGKFINQVTCEGAMSYLCDSQTRRWNFLNQTPTQILTYLLDQHNLKVDVSKKIYVGTIQKTQPITIDTNYETTLNAIVTKLHNILGGDLKVRETAGILYLDYLTSQGANNGVKVQIGINAKQMIREYDPADVVTRVIPLGYGEGINQLDIKAVNGGIEFIEDATAMAKYGVIEGLVTNKDLQNASTLKIYGETVLAEKKQPKLIIDTAMVDRSVLVQYSMEKYGLGDTLQVVADIVSINVSARVIERERDLINSPWDPTLTISTRTITLSDQMIDLKQRNLTLEQAPQGNTCIFPIQAAENADLGNPIRLDLDIPAETININRVSINLHGRKYRAYEKGMAAGGSSSSTTATSSSGGSSTPTSDPSSATSTDASSASSTAGEDPHRHWKEGDPPDPDRTGWAVTTHNHSIPHTHGIGHTHGVSIGSHQHTVPIPSIPEHAHAIDYGIFESTFPLNTRIKVNGIDIGLNFGDGSSSFDEYNLDITSHIFIGNNKIEISTEQNGRIEAIIYSQIFIQSK
jgi:phage minor structural protein